MLIGSVLSVMILAGNVCRSINMKLTELNKLSLISSDDIAFGEYAKSY